MYGSRNKINDDDDDYDDDDEASAALWEVQQVEECN